MWSTVKDRKAVKDLVQMLGLSEALDQLTMTHSMYWYGHVLKMKDLHVLKSRLLLSNILALSLHESNHLLFLAMIPN